MCEHTYRVPGCSEGASSAKNERRECEGAPKQPVGAGWRLSLCCHKVVNSSVVTQLCPCCPEGCCGTYQKRVIRPHIIEGNKYSSKKPADTNRWITTDTQLQDTGACMRDGHVMVMHGK